MSLCINLSCPHPQNRDFQLVCESCGSKLLLQQRYWVTRPLGRDGFVTTYEIQDRNGIVKLLKVLIHDRSQKAELFQREAQVLCFQRQAEVLSQLDHPGLPKVEPDGYFLFSPNKSQTLLHCLAREKIEGLNLQQYIQKQGKPIDQPLAIQWLIQLATTLQVLHNHRFFHWDINLSNIIHRGDASGQLVLIGFGTAVTLRGIAIAKQAVNRETAVMQADYTPPEQLNGQVGPHSDFFSLGRTFVYLLTGKNPSDFYKLPSGELQWRDAAPGVSPQFADLLDSLMAFSPAQRPQTAEVILQKLAEINRSLSSSKVKPNPDLKPKASSAVLLDDATERLTPLVLKSLEHLSEVENKQHVTPETSFTGSSDNAKQQRVRATPPSRLDPNFIARCQEELSELIGPIASVVCKRTLNENPGLSATEFVEALAKKIPNPQQALMFQRHLRF